MGVARGLVILTILLSGCTTVHESKDWPGVTVSPAREPTIVLDDQKFWLNATPTPGPERAR